MKKKIILISLFLAFSSMIYAKMSYDDIGIISVENKAEIQIVIDQFCRGIQGQNLKVIEGCLIADRAVLSTIQNAGAWDFLLKPDSITIKQGKAVVKCQLSFASTGFKQNSIVELCNTEQGWKIVNIQKIIDCFKIYAKSKKDDLKNNILTSLLNNEENDNIKLSVATIDYGTTFIQQNANYIGPVSYRRLTRSITEQYFFGKELFSHTYSSDMRIRADGINLKFMSVATDPTWNRLIYNGGYYDTDILYATERAHFVVPKGLAGAKNGDYYVADAASGKIIVYHYNLVISNYSLNYEREITGFEVPYDVCYDDNVAYVGDSPYDIWDDNDDLIWVVDVSQKKITCLSIGGGNYQPYTISTYPANSSDYQFIRPVSVAVGKRTSVWVSPSNPYFYFTYTINTSDIYVVDQSANKIVWLQKNGTGPLLFKDVYQGNLGQDFVGVETDPMGNVYILDKANCCIIKLDKYLNYLFSYGSFGEGQYNDNTFNMPTSTSNLMIDRFADGFTEIATIGSDQLFTSEKWSDLSGGLRHQIGVDMVDLKSVTTTSNMGMYYAFTLTDYANVTIRADFQYPTASQIIYEGALAPGFHLYYFDNGIVYNSTLTDIRVDAYSLYTTSDGTPTLHIQRVFSRDPIQITILNCNFEDKATYIMENQIAYSQDVTSQSAIRIATDGDVLPHGGSWMYKVTGSDIGSVESGYCYWNLTNIPLVITENTYLSFWRYVKESPDGEGHIFIDGVTSDGMTFRDWNIENYLCDQNGLRMHPSVDRPQTSGDGWRQYIVNLSPMAGKVVNLMIGYDDGNPSETGIFTAYFDDIEIRQGYPYSNEWYAYAFGNNTASALSLSSNSGDGVNMNYYVWYSYIDGETEWKNGPYLRKNIEPDIVIPEDKDLYVNWTQYDYVHSLLFMFIVEGTDGVGRWLLYAANASNHWSEQGYVDMGSTTEYYCQEISYSRNISKDYYDEFGVTAAKINYMLVGHFSSTKMDGQSGGYVKDISFYQGDITLPSSPLLTAAVVSVLSKAPDPGDNTVYYAKLSWTASAGTYPISYYKIYSRYTYNVEWTDRGIVYSSPWQDPVWPLNAGDIVYRICAIDSKGNIGTWSNEVLVKKPSLPTRPNNHTKDFNIYSNGKKIGVDNKGYVHMVHSSGDSVYYSLSTNDGASWSGEKTFVGIGKYPALALNGEQVPTICWISGNCLYGSKKANSGFINPYLIYAGQEGTMLSSLSYVLNQSNNKAYLSWIEESSNGSVIKMSDCDPYTYILSSTAAIDNGEIGALGSPSLALDRFDNINIAWSHSGKIYYKGNIGQSEIGQNGSNPNLDIYGDRTTVIWQEEILPGINQIVKRTKGPLGWSDKKKVSYPDSLNADYPVVSVSGQYVYSKNVRDKDYDLVLNSEYENGWLMSIQNISVAEGGLLRYPSLAFKQDWPKSQLHILWTEEILDDDIKTTEKLLANYVESVDPMPYFYIDAGTEESKVYAIQRKGAYYYGPHPDYTVDYDPVKLIYSFSGLNPLKKYLIKASYYHESNKSIIQVLAVDNTLNVISSVVPKTKTTTESWISSNCIKDGKIDVTITKSSGDYAVCSVIVLYEFDEDFNESAVDITESNDKTVVPISYALMQSYPNPTTGKAAIKYQLAQPGKVSLKIYNTLGQVVKTLVEQNQTAGYYNVAWDGKDNAGKATANGVYFYRLESGDFKATKKMVVIR